MYDWSIRRYTEITATFATSPGTSQFTKYLGVIKEIEQLVTAGSDVTLGTPEELTNEAAVDQIAAGEEIHT